jgi:hypothetical protein
MSVLKPAHPNSFSFAMVSFGSWSTLLKDVTLPPSPMPRFKGQAVYTSNEPTAKILERFVKSSAQMSVLTSLQVPPPAYQKMDYPYQLIPHVVVFDYRVDIEWLIQDDSDDKNVMALKLDKSIAPYGNPEKHGGILLLPDFQQNNINVALALLQEVITERSPHLFDTPQHPWLEKYQPIPVARLIAEKEAVIAEATRRIEGLGSQAETKREEFAWLLGLLVSQGDQFAEYAAQALRFLGFEVEEVDKTLSPGERKREDLRIWDKAAGYFALGEAKTTGKVRGAAEDFITKTQTHQTQYALDNHQEPPPAILIVNYATDLEPVQRTGRFYQAEISGRLETNRITALNSVALFDLCQLVLEERLSREQVRRFIASGRPLIPSITPDEVAASHERPTT